MVIFVVAIILTLLLRGGNCGKGSDNGAFVVDVIVFLIILGVLVTLFG